MTEALQVLAEARNSTRLREFLRSGVDREFIFMPSNLSHFISRLAAGEEGTVIVPDWPRGLNQLGNTCYLNSLLQVRLGICLLASKF